MSRYVKSRSPWFQEPDRFLGHHWHRLGEDEPRPAKGALFMGGPRPADAMGCG